MRSKRIPTRLPRRQYHRHSLGFTLPGPRLTCIVCNPTQPCNLPPPSADLFDVIGFLSRRLSVRPPISFPSVVMIVQKDQPTVLLPHAAMSLEVLVSIYSWICATKACSNMIITVGLIHSSRARASKDIFEPVNVRINYHDRLASDHAVNEGPKLALHRHIYKSVKLLGNIHFVASFVV